MEKKVRIQTFTKEGIPLSDRLVSQESEFYIGPKEKHAGPIRVEFTFLDKEDLDSAIEYLKVLLGDLPLKAKGSTKKAKPRKVEDIDNREEFLKESLNVQGDQDALINHLRENGFVFVMTDFIEMLDLKVNFKERHKDKYQWMIRMLRRAKNPKNDKYDPMLIYGISMLERSETIVVYLNGEYNSKFKMELPEKPRETYKKSGMIKFPHFMVAEEREKFRVELRALLDNPNKKPSKFFTRWKPYVENIPALPKKEENKKEE